MKKLLSSILCIVMFAAVLTACQDPNSFSNSERLSDDYTRSTDPQKSFNYNDGAQDPPSTYTFYASSVTDFELRMFRNYYQQSKEEAFVFSPAGTALELGYLMNGASGDTKNEISLAVGKDVSEENFNLCSSYFQSRLKAVSLSEKDESSNSSEKEKEADTDSISLNASVFINDTADVKSAFMQANASYYANDIFRFIFSDENSAAKVNSQLGLSGEKAFKSLDKSDSMFTVSSSKIIDSWLEPYAKSDISEGTFHSESGQKTVSFLSSSESYLKTDKAQGIVKYTKSNPLKLVLVMPNEGISLEDYIGDFTSLEYSKLLSSFDVTKKATAQIPEFSIASSQQLNPLSPILSKSGLYSFFTDEAVFKSASNDNNFRINEMYENTPDFSLNAYGIGKKDDGSLLQKKVGEPAKNDIELKFDRPFIFLLIDNESEIPVYIGIHS